MQIWKYRTASEKTSWGVCKSRMNCGAKKTPTTDRTSPKPVRKRILVETALRSLSSCLAP